MTSPGTSGGGFELGVGIGVGIGVGVGVGDGVGVGVGVGNGVGVGSGEGGNWPGGVAWPPFENANGIAATVAATARGMRTERMRTPVATHLPP